MPPGPLALEIGRIVEEVVKSGKDPDTAVITRITEHLAKGFNVKNDEIGVMLLTTNGKHLVFVIPEKFQKVGTIPMTSTSSLAVRTARDKRPELNNNFTAAKHPTVFEAIPLVQERGTPIQKIMSAPLVHEGKSSGVIQISRKGKTPGAAGPDFAPKDLQELVAVGAALAKCFRKPPEE